MTRSFPVIVFVISLIATSCDSPSDQDPELAKPVFRIHVGPEFRPPNENGDRWVFVADEEGVPSEAYEIINDSTITIDLASFDPSKDKFTLNMFACYYYEKPNGVTNRAYSMITYTDVLPGDYNLFDYPDDPTGVSSVHQIKIEYVPFGTPFYCGAYGKNVKSFATTQSQNTLKCNTNFYGDKADITYYAAVNGECRYIKIHDALPDQKLVVDYSTMIPMENSVAYKFEKMAEVSIRSYGVDDHDLRHLTKLTAAELWNLPSPYEFKFYYPADHYDEYYTDLLTLSADRKIRRSYQKLGATVSTAFKIWNGSITGADVEADVLTTTLSNTAGVLEVVSNSSRNVDGSLVGYYWGVFMPGDLTHTTKLPQLPESLAVQHPAWAQQDLKFNTGFVTDFAGAAGYSDFIKHTLQPASPQDLTNFLYSPTREVVTHWQLLGEQVFGGRTSGSGRKRFPGDGEPLGLCRDDVD